MIWNIILLSMMELTYYVLINYYFMVYTKAYQDNLHGLISSSLKRKKLLYEVILKDEDKEKNVVERSSMKDRRKGRKTSRKCLWTIE